jgi:hypothetical protein
VRYRIDAAVGAAAHCHCTMCRRASGAVAVTWFTIAPAAFALTAGEFATWRFSAKGERGFCPDCGCQITFRHDDAPGELDVTLATLDDAADHPAARHIWTDSRLPWLTLDPRLPASPREESDRQT